MDDMVAIVPPEAAARIVRAGRALMVLHWATVAVVAYFIVLALLYHQPHFVMWALVGVLVALGYVFLGTRCPRCAHPFFGEKTGFGVMFGRFTCVACGYDPTVHKRSGEYL
jgi:hypothetical protein